MEKSQKHIVPAALWLSPFWSVIFFNNLKWNSICLSPQTGQESEYTAVTHLILQPPLQQRSVVLELGADRLEKDKASLSSEKYGITIRPDALPPSSIQTVICFLLSPPTTRGN